MSSSLRLEYSYGFADEEDFVCKGLSDILMRKHRDP